MNVWGEENSLPMSIDPDIIFDFVVKMYVWFHHTVNGVIKATWSCQQREGGWLVLRQRLPPPC